MNLLKNYGLSLSEIYRASRVVEEFIPQLAPVREDSWTKKFIKTFLTALLSFGLVAVLVIIILNPFKKTIVLEDPPPPPPPPRLSPVPERPGFVQIQVIEFADTTEAAAPNEANGGTSQGVAIPGGDTGRIEILPLITGSPRPGSVPEEPREAPIPTVPVTQPEPPQRPMPAPPPPPKPKPVTAPAPTPKISPAGNPVYSVYIASTTPAEYDILKKLAQEYGTKANIVNIQKQNSFKWQVYVPWSNTGVFIDGTEVLLVNTFPSRDEALKYAETRGTDAIIKAEEDPLMLYDLSICCMELNDAKIYARKSGITDKLFQLKRE